MEYYSATKMNEIMSFVATWTDLEIIMLSEVSQAKANIMWYHLYVEPKKNGTNEFIDNRLTDIVNKLMITKGEKGDKLEIWD